MTGGTVGFTEEEFFAAHFPVAGFGTVEPSKNIQFRCGGKIEQFLHFGHIVNLRASVQNAQSFLGSSHRIAVEVRRALLELSGIFDSLQCSL